MIRRPFWVPFIASFALMSGCATLEEVCKEAYVTTHPDNDGDGYGDAGAPEQTCGIPKGRVKNSGDCDDTAADSHIDADEICDLRDNNCDGQVDEGLPFQSWYPDADGDGHGAGAGSVETCLPPEGSVESDDDCDDNNVAVNPSATEICDGIDNDCDLLIDDLDDDVDVTTMETFFADQDGDGYGSFLDPLDACRQPAGSADNGDDCDDTDDEVNPGAVEICNNIDDNCDALIDEDDPTIDPALLTTFFVDADGDGYGDILSPIVACGPGPGIVDNYDDCDDSDFLLGPPGDWYVDADGDGFGAGNPVEFATCAPTDPNLVPDLHGLDCDDDNGVINPLAAEVCGDGIDSNCDLLDCPNPYIIDFETNAFEPYWTQGGNAPWTILGVNPYEGIYGMKSGTISHNETSRVTVNVFMAWAGTVTFWHRGNTEPNYDYLQFYLDGGIQWSKAGNWGWTQQNFNVPAGNHTLHWRYEKDATVNGGADKVYVDFITIIGGEPL